MHVKRRLTSVLPIAALAIAMVGGIVAAEQAQETSTIVVEKPPTVEHEKSEGPPVSADVSLRSAYVSRGQVNSDRPVVQPQVVISKFGFNVGIWANSELTDHSVGHRGISEIDMMVNYQLPVEPVDIIVGVIEYEYPGAVQVRQADGTEDEISVPSTREVFLAAEWDNPWLTPGLDIYYDFGEADGFYVDARLEHAFSIVPGLSFTPGVSIGWGSRKFNEYYFASDLNALNDGNAYAKLEYAWQNGLKLAGDIAYTWLWDKEIRDNAGQIYMDNRQLYGGTTLTYEF